MIFGKGRASSQARTRPRRALFCWEYGGGHTHVANIAAVAERLHGAGVECLVALHDLRESGRFAALGIPVVQSYVWPHARRWVPHDRERPHLGFLDVLGNLGFGEADWVAGAIAHYDGLFALFDPHLVLAENAYGVQVAARGRLPAIAFGFGAYLPAIREGRFAFPETAPTSWTAEEILAGLNAGLARAGREPMERLEDVFDVTALYPFGPTAFDPNAALRDGPLMAAHVPAFRPGLRAGGGTEIFVYLQGGDVQDPAIMAALLSIRRPIRAHIPDLDPADRALLTDASVLLEDGVMPIETIVERSRCVLHRGGVGLIAACLSAGLPQVILPKQPDHRVAGAFVAREGLGCQCEMAAVETAWLVEAARRAYDDEALIETCKAKAPAFDTWFVPDPAEIVASDALRLLHGRLLTS